MHPILLIYLIVTFLTFALCWVGAEEATAILKAKYPDKAMPHRPFISRCAALLRSVILCGIPLLNLGMLLYVCINWSTNVERTVKDIEKTLIPKEVA